MQETCTDSAVMIRADSIGMPANEITSSRRGSSPVVSTSIAMNRASRQGAPRPLNAPEAVLVGDASLDPRDRAKRLLQRGPGKGVRLFGLDQVIGILAVSELRDLVLHAERGEQLERVAQVPRVVRAERSRLLDAFRRARVEAALTPARSPLHRASASTGSSPRRLMSSTPLRSPVE